MRVAVLALAALFVVAPLAFGLEGAKGSGLVVRCREIE